MLIGDKEVKYNVFAWNLQTLDKRLIAANKSIEDAEAIADMATIRRGVEEEVFFAEPVKEEEV